LIGDSAGGGLAVTTILRAREQGLPLPAATMPLSPWLDMDATGETFETNAAKDLIVTRDLIQGMAGMFLGEGGNLQDPLANPLHADLNGFPPIYIQLRLCRGSISLFADVILAVIKENFKLHFEEIERAAG
jgi:acetyl esterase/lipase